MTAGRPARDDPLQAIIVDVVFVVFLLIITIIMAIVISKTYDLAMGESLLGSVGITGFALLAALALRRGGQ